MQKIKYFIRPRYDINADGFTLVELNLRIDGLETRISLEYYLQLKYWDRKKRVMVAKKGLTKTEALQINLELQGYIDRCAEIVRNARMNGEFLSLQSFESKLWYTGKPLNLIEFTENWIEENPDNNASSSLKTYSKLIGVWKDAFGNTVGLGDIPDIRPKIEKAMLKRKHSLNTRKKNHSKTKSMIKRAIKAGYPITNPYTEPIGGIKGNRNFLNPDELRLAIKIYKRDYLPDHLQKTLKVFLFACFTGCRISDMQELRKNNIVGDSLQYIAVKTRRYQKRVEVPLPEVARALIDKPIVSGPLFDMRCEATINKNLKAIFKILKINKSISYHCARHTFGTLYIYLGGEVTNLKEMMAHSKIDTTMVYVGMAKRLTINEKRLFDEEFASDMKVILKGKGEIMEAV
ncbi:site-specific recombinase XerD [Owenweeksia hongkongensis DSM 17368]|uniref:Site-specific recombinase XerD n=1 Tax=Owenweeksia hongkongensis (strain DSM 17368 / CIP 108786 / JCM 12287 / NRRL B-23963 / UST20020801) TaxID=926562 RepID=G8R3Q1_OWEHD|nr:site-specific integrase [Owenweeksia hongkongensis]AEV34138.1 site-specific recombinase XerD [Owenweeksia hongkongensis DSM 17368]